MTTTARFSWPALVGGLGFALAVAPTVFAPPAASGEELRVESEVFADGGQEPIGRSLTLFRDGLAWDFLERPAQAGGPSGADSATDEIVLHDPARERVVIVDPRRNIKTQIDSLRLERLSVSLASWARKADDRLVRWAGGPDFGEGIHEDEEKLELIGPRVRYAVEFAEAPSADTADVYRRFADTAMLLKALLHPGGIPPFPRLAINRHVSAAGGIPTSVTLEIDSKAAMIGGRPQVLRSVHRVHPKLLGGDIERIEEAEARIAVAEPVDLATYMAKEPPDGSSAAE